MTSYCDFCLKSVEPRIELRRETYNVKGEEISINSSVCVCPHCEMDLWVSEIDDANLNKAYDAYRESHKLLSPAEIKRIREKYGLSQTTFARILGFGDKTIARYETGSIQEEAPNNLIALVDNVYNFQMLYDRNRHKLSITEQRKIDETIRYLNKLSSDFHSASTTYVCVDFGFASTLYNYKSREELPI